MNSIYWVCLMWELFWVPCLVEILKRVAFQWRQRQTHAWPSMSRVKSWRSWTYCQYWVSRWIWLSMWASIAGDLPSLSLNFSLMSLPALFSEKDGSMWGICLPPHYSLHFPLRCRREQWYWSSRVGQNNLLASVVRVPAVALALFSLLLLWQITIHTGA